MPPEGFEPAIPASDLWVVGCKVCWSSCLCCTDEFQILLAVFRLNVTFWLQVVECLFQKLTFLHLVEKFPEIYENATVHYRAHKSLSLFPCPELHKHATPWSYRLQGPMNWRSIPLDPWKVKWTLSFETSGTHHPKTQRRISENFSRERAPNSIWCLFIFEFNFRIL